MGSGYNALNHLESFGRLFEMKYDVYLRILDILELSPFKMFAEMYPIRFSPVFSYLKGKTVIRSPEFY